MEIPQVVTRFVDSQSVYDSEAFTECFTDTAVVHDEGKVHHGKEEIHQWIGHAMEAYKSQLKPLAYEQNASSGILTADVSGTFPGSPIVLKFHFGFKDGLIDSLNVTE